MMGVMLGWNRLPRAGGDLGEKGPELPQVTEVPPAGEIPQELQDLGSRAATASDLYQIRSHRRLSEVPTRGEGVAQQHGHFSPGHLPYGSPQVFTLAAPVFVPLAEGP